MLLTKSTTFIIGPVATLLGYIMNGIFWVQSQIGIESIGLCIILFTIVIYMLLMPLTIKQQKFSKLQSKMNPELQAIQKKYKDKRQDQAAMMKMNEETQAVYQKYGVNPMGSCLQLIIQMPILFALYRVIWNIPAYRYCKERLSSAGTGTDECERCAGLYGGNCFQKCSKL